MTATLYKIAKQFNDKRITWALGGHALLEKYELIEQAEEITLLVVEKDFEQVTEILNSLGSKMKPLATKGIYQYKIAEVIVTLICQLVIEYKGNSYPYTFDQLSITDTGLVARIKIYYTCLEDWYVIYNLMGDHKDYVKEIKNYFLLKGVTNHELFSRSLANIPHDLKLRIEFDLGL